MKKILLVLALMGLSYSAHADSVVNDQNLRFAIPQAKDTGVPDVNFKWSLGRIGRAEFSSAVLISSGTGLVDGVCISSGALAAGTTQADYVVVADSNTAFGWNLANFATPANVSSTLDVVYSPGYGVAGNAVSEAGCHMFNPGLPFSNGLLLFPSSANSRSYVRYRLLRR